MVLWIPSMQEGIIIWKVGSSPRHSPSLSRLFGKYTSCFVLYHGYMNTRPIYPPQWAWLIYHPRRTWNCFEVSTAFVYGKRPSVF